MSPHPDPSDPLLAVAVSVADGAPVDWDIAAAARPDDAALLSDLALISRISALHGAPTLAPWMTMAQELEDGPGAVPPEPVTWGGLEIIERVGRGTFGTVYRARDPKLDRDVALKLLRGRQGGATAADTHVIAEARLMARVRHPNIVTIFGADVIDGQAGLWMEFVEGRTLEEELRQNGPLSTHELRRVGHDLCGALKAVHRAGLLHRDVKAQNALRDRDGRVLLSDFGTGVEAASGVNGEGRPDLVGTLLYVAPEVAAARPATVQSDIYSLGVLLYRMATGRFPRAVSTLEALREIDAHPEAHRVTLDRPDLPAALRRAIERALVVDPSGRYESVETFSRAFDPPRSRLGRGVFVAAVVVSLVSLLWFASRPPAAGAVDGVVARTDAWLITDIDAAGRNAVGTDRPTDSSPPRLLVADLRTGAQRWLQAGPPGTYVFNPVISADGQRVAYRVSTRAQAGARGFPSWLYVLNLDGRSDPTLLREVEVGTHLLPLAWNDAGTTLLLFMRQGLEDQEERPTQSFAWLRIADGDLRVRPVPRRVYAPGTMAVSPDLRLVAHPTAVGSGSMQMVISDLVADRATPVPLGGINSSPVWSQDGRQLLFAGDRSGQRALWAVPVVNGKPSGEPVMIENAFAGMPLHVAPNGGILYTEQVSGDPLEFLVDRSTASAGVSQSFIGEKGRWAPDGSHVATVRSLHGETAIIVRHIESGRERTYVRPDLVLTPPIWLSNEEMLVSVGAREASEEAARWAELHRLNITTGEFVRRFPRSTSQEVRVPGGVSRDRALLFVVVRPVGEATAWSRIAELDAVTGIEVSSVPLPPGRFHREANPTIRLSPDGTRFAVVAWAPGSPRVARLFVMDRDGSNFRELWQPFPADYLGWTVEWTPDSRHVLLMNTDRSGVARVMRVDAADGTAVPDGVDTGLLEAAVPGVRLDVRLGFTMDLSPDGRTLLIASSTVGRSVISRLRLPQR